MISLPGYEILHQTDNRNGCVRFFARHHESACPVHLKFYPLNGFPPTDPTAVESAYNGLTAIRSDHVSRVYAVEKITFGPHTGVLLTMEAACGIALAQIFGPDHLTLEGFLDTAIDLASAVNDIHKAGMVHRGLTGETIRFNRKTGRIRVDDFAPPAMLGRAATLYDDHDLRLSGIPAVQLAYISPEQTGRMNRPVDYRSDFYSLGVIFYALLTGHPPFTATEPKEIVYAHIALEPIAPSELRPEIPSPVADIVMKLLSKAPEDRYQSACGIRADLLACRRRLKVAGHIEAALAIGEDDAPEVFALTDALFGRESELQRLESAYDDIRQGAISTLLVTGPEGIGKTRLVETFGKRVNRMGGHFIFGSYEEMQHSIPYSGIIQAFQGLIRRILAENAEQVDTWRRHLLAVLGENAGIVVNVIPELEYVIGKPPEPLTLSPADTQNRFNTTFEKFFRAFGTKEQPLVIFIDNLQWADAASLQQLEAFFSGSNARHILFIGAYRKEALGKAHPLTRTTETLLSKNPAAAEIALSPLHHRDIEHLIHRSLKKTGPDTTPLAEVVHAKTGGNPFFVRQFLTALEEEGSLAYDFDRGWWHWRIESVRQKRLARNVITFLAEKIRQVPESTQKTLKLAACIGNRFHLGTLAMLAGKDTFDVAFDLWEALERDFLTISAPEYRQLRELLIHYLPPTSSRLPEEARKMERIVFDFQHDKLRRAVYCTIPESTRKRLHLQIGNHLLKDTERGAPVNRLFETVNHLNLGKGLLSDAVERVRLAELNRTAGRKAIDSRAYAQAIVFFETGRRLLPEDAWGACYDLAFSLAKGQMECHYLNQDFDKAEAIFRSLIGRAGTDIDRADIYNVKMMMLAGLAKHDDTLRIGRIGLRLLGIRLPAKAGRLSVLRHLTATRWRLFRHGQQDLQNIDRMENRRLLLAMELLINLTFSAFLCNPYMAIIASLKLVEITLRHGQSKASPFGYMVYGASLCAIFKNYKAGRRFGKLALAANEACGSRALTSKLLLLYGSGISIWCDPIHKGLEHHRMGVKAALESGDSNYAVYHIQSVLIFLIASGATVDTVAAECEKYFKFIQNSKDIGALNYLISARQFVKGLKGETVHPQSLDSTDFSEAEHIAAMQEHAIPIILLRHYLLKLRLCVIMGDTKGARAAAAAGRKLLPYHLGTLIVPEFHFYEALALADTCRETPKKKRTGYLLRIRRYRNKLALLACQCPENFRQHHLLIAAELAGLTGRDFDAMPLYHQAIRAARENGFIHIHAIANERAALFYRRRRFDDIARPCLIAARDAYRQWGATAKAAALENRFPEIPAGRLPDKSLATFDPLDFAAIFGALQTISTEIVLSDLLKNLMRLVMENAGATRTRLFTLKADRLYLEAELDHDSRFASVYQNLPADNRISLFTPVINFVRRTGQPMVLDDATGHRDFAAHAYVRSCKPRSVLCLPVIRQTRLVALLYLENRNAPCVFTPSRIEVLQLLASQAAISLENARLYENVIESEKRLREMTCRREEEFLRYQSQLRSLSSELSLTEERERRRIATQLHDRIGHALATASMKMQLLGNRNGAGVDETGRMITDIHSLVEQSIADTQTLTFELSPPILYDLGLEAALDWLAEQTQQRHGIQVRCIDDATPLPLDESLRVLLFQAARELLFNVVKHARASSASIIVSHEAERVRVAIEDDGTGFDPDKPMDAGKKGGFGLFSIRERLAHQGGFLEIRSKPGSGTRITMLCPVKRVREEKAPGKVA